MVNIAVLVTENVLIAVIGNILYLFQKANDFLEEKGQKHLFQVQLVGISSEIQLKNGMFKVHRDQFIDTVESPNLIIIPPLEGEMEVSRNLNSEFLPWIRNKYQMGSKGASLCAGAFLLAETGLLRYKLPIKKL